MQIVQHIGANCTDGDKLVKSIVRNARTMAERGICIPLPSKYRRLLRETIQNLNGSAPSPDTRNILLDAIMDDAPAERLVMSNTTFICVPNRVFEAGEFYGLLTMKVRALQQLFPDDTVELHLATRNPATFVPALWEQVRNRTFQAFMGGVDVRRLRWSEVVHRLRAIAPGARLTVWCNEDTPLIWGDVLRRVIGVEDGVALEGEHDLLATIMTPEGLKRFESYLETHPPQTALQKRRVIAAFLDKYARPEEVEEEVDLPGWDAALVHELTETYEADVAEIRRIEGITFLEP